MRTDKSRGRCALLILRRNAEVKKGEIRGVLGELALGLHTGSTGVISHRVTSLHLPRTIDFKVPS